MIRLTPMTRELCHSMYRDFENDPALLVNKGDWKPFVYTSDWVEAYYDRQVNKKRVYLAIMSDTQPVGEILLKQFADDAKTCVLGIALKNDDWKGRGIGKQAIRLALDYAFQELGLQAVLADALIGNTRSQHVLSQVGFKWTHQDDTFRYYICKPEDYIVRKGT